jgi:predicted transcriptional regulator
VAATEATPRGQRVRLMRQVTGLSEAELAQLVGVTVEEIARIEAGGEMSRYVVEAIFDACAFQLDGRFKPRP